MPLSERPSALVVDATLRALVLRAGGRPWREGVLDVQPEDLRRAVRARRQTELFVVTVDASDSMGAQARMAAAKGAVVGLLLQAHVQRDRVALVAFEGMGARVVVPPTRSAGLARTRLAGLEVGGATPLAAGLWEAWQLARTQRRKDPTTAPVLVLVTDGEANVERRRGRAIREELRELAQRIAEDKVRAVVVDTNGPFAGSRALVELAGWLGGSYHHVQRMDPGSMMLAVLRTRG